MERGIQEPGAVESLLAIANRDATAEFEAKLLAGKIQTRQVADRLLAAIRTHTVGPPTEEHRLTYTYPDGIRVNILDATTIHKVCTTQKFANIPLTVERKVKYFDAAGGRDMVDVPELLTRFTLRSETHVKNDFTGNVNDPAAHIRLIHRKSYTARGGEFRFDISLVKTRSRKQTLREMFKEVPSYELEIEYIAPKNPRPPADVLHTLTTLIESILAAYQESDAILLQSEIQKYAQEFRYTGARFYNLVSLERRHLGEQPHSILKGYTVTNKADGLRGGLYVARDRRLLRITNGGDVIAWTGLVALNDAHVEDFLDGEYIKERNLFCIFDVYRYKTKDVKGLPLFTTDEEIRSTPETSRLGCAHLFVQSLTTDFKTVTSGLRIETKMFLAGDGPAMEQAIRTILDTHFEYETDGLIFTPRLSAVAPPADTKGNTWLRVYKWKPPHQNSIDFLMRFDGQPEYDGVTRSMARKGTLFISKTPGRDITYPCETITGEYVPPSMPADLQHIADTRDRVPAPFQPSAPRSPDAYQIWVPVDTDGMTHDSAGKRVDDNTIVECVYDVDTRRWSIMRTRDDKTFQYRVKRESQYGNDIETAESIWTLIHVPVSDEMLKNVVSVAPDDTFGDDVYYKDDVDLRDSIMKNIRGFHNRVKDSLYQAFCMPGNTLLELAVGRAGDLHKWRKVKLSKILGIELSTSNLTSSRQGACVRYLNEKKRGVDNLPKILFAQGDMTKPFEDQQSRYLNIAFGTEEASTPYLTQFKNVEWDLASCQFAIHYACESEETFKIFVENVKAHCSSILFGTCLDGQAVYSLLAGKDRYILRSQGKTFAQFDKKYSDDGGWKNEFGQRIDVLLETIEKPTPEFLVPFDKVVEIFNEAGFDLHETKMFGDLYSAQSGISLDQPQQEYSFLHRTFAFKKRPVQEVTVEVKVPTFEPAVEPTVESETKVVVTDKKKRLVKEEAPKQEILFFMDKAPENAEFTRFYESVFTIEDVPFKTAEHAYQAMKAKMFGDEESYQKILKAKSGQSAKSFGKKVAGYVEAAWGEKKEQVMRDILRAKFTQNPTIHQVLLDSGDKLLAEANPRDKYWGIGTSSGTSIAKNPAKWKGENKLGKLLMALREELAAEDAEQAVASTETESKNE